MQFIFQNFKSVNGWIIFFYIKSHVLMVIMKENPNIKIKKPGYYFTSVDEQLLKGVYTDFSFAGQPQFL